MPSKPTGETPFEAFIEAYLVAHGYTKRAPGCFDAERALDREVLISFIKVSQPATWKNLESFHGANTAFFAVDELCRALASRGMLNVLRHGFKCYGKLVRVAFFAPANRMNPETEALYKANQLSVMRQVHFSTKNPALSIDMVLCINGLPVVTVELKNQFSGQSATNSIRQYQEDRDPREPIFRFKERALVHFAVDTNVAFMTTRLEGKSTRFLPFNRGDHGGAGNPLNPKGHATAYLWEQVWQRDSLLDLFGRFLHLEVEDLDITEVKKGKTAVKRVRKESVVFPRYHQVDAVRRLTAAAKAQGPGHQYLVQHSAGSGKSNTIAWLAHQLSNLHDDQDWKVFDSVIVITDRIVLDKQLQDTIYQFEHKQGVVQKIDKDSAQLAQALVDQTPIIITTLQKFPFVTDKIGSLPERRYAVIVDEAHSSQSGETAAELKAVLADAQLHKKAQELAKEEVVEDSADDAALLTVLRAKLEALKRGRQSNLSFFAFTATPKYKTLKIFDEPGLDGKAPFHLYTMRQAIEERFILDVLKNYVTYKTYYRLIEHAANDPMVPRREAARTLARYMQHHPHNVASKVEVMVEHFRTHTRHKIGGRAKAMVVTDSRLSAVRYKLEFDRYLKEKGYSDIRTLVAFSGTVVDDDAGGASYTEPQMNGFGEKELPERFDTEEYQVLLVAEKYQTGFDQPLLHSMYVDKRLDGVQAVQTLSRLNRIARGKEDTFVLDFRNERDDIFQAFKPYYEVTDSDGDVDPQKLYELQGELDGAHVYYHAEVDEFCKTFFAAKAIENLADHPTLNRIVDQAVARFKGLDEDAQEDFRGKLMSFRNLYAFLSQVVPYPDSDLEKLYTYARFLLSKLPRRKRDSAVDLSDDVELKFYRLQKVGEGSIQLGTGEPEPLTGPADVGTGTAEDERVKLSSLIEKLNERFGTDFTPADQLFFDQVQADALQRGDLKLAATANNVDDFKLKFEKELEGLFIDRMEGNSSIFKRLMEDENFRNVASEWLTNEVYQRAREHRTHPASKPARPQ